MFQWPSNLNEEERVRQNVKNLLSLRINDVPWNRGMGLSIDYVDKPVGDITSDIVTKVDDLISEWEYRAEVDSCELVEEAYRQEQTMEEVIT